MTPEQEQWRELADLAARLEAEQHFSGVLRATRGEEVLHESCHGLADRGEVGLHDAVVDVLPAGSRPSTLSPEVTVHHLLSHTSGIADYAEEDEQLPGYQPDYGAVWADLPNYRVRDDLDILPLFADLPPVCPPGTAYHYSNAGYVLLGILLSSVSGLPFAEAVGTRVLAPAGMMSSGYPALDEVHPGVATGYLPPLAPGGPWRTNVYSVPARGGGDGGAVVSAADVERFLRAVARGGVWRGVTPQDVLTPRAGEGPRWAVGYGVELRYDGVFGKDGGDPGVAALCRYRAATDTTVVALANVGWDTVEDLEDVADALVDLAMPEPVVS